MKNVHLLHGNATLKHESKVIPSDEGYSPLVHSRFRVGNYNLSSNIRYLALAAIFLLPNILLLLISIPTTPLDLVS